MASIQLDLELEATSSFIGYLSGNVVELTLKDRPPSDALCVVVQCEALTEEGLAGLEVRRFDDDQGKLVGDSFVIDLDEVDAISVY